MLRNSAHADHRFRRMAIADFGACRSPIPALPITLRRAQGKL
jgi:hypothetical protein